MKKTETKPEMKDKPKMKKNDENDFFKGWCGNKDLGFETSANSDCQ